MSWTDRKSRKRAHDGEHVEEGAHVEDEGAEGVDDPEVVHEGADEEPTLEQQLADLDARYRRALADYQNFQRRASENEKRAREFGAVEVVQALIPVLDHCKLALTMDPEKASAQQVLDGVKGILDQFFTTMARFGVEPIDPARGEEFNPGRHEAMMQTDDPGVDPGAIAQVLQSGYAVRERVVRPAQVSVRPADAGDDDDRASDTGDEE
jgi:molecular chaperone GrpE